MGVPSPLCLSSDVPDRGSFSHEHCRTCSAATGPGTRPTRHVRPAVSVISLACLLRRRGAAAGVRVKGLARHLGRLDGDAVCWALDQNPRAPSQARRLIRDQLARWGLDEHADTTGLLATELVTNALTHARGPIRMSMALSPWKRTLRCGITDVSPLPPRPHRARHDEEHGRGLQLLDELASRWGSRQTSGGKAVWFELCTGDAARFPRLSLWRSIHRGIKASARPGS